MKKKNNRKNLIVIGAVIVSVFIIVFVLFSYRKDDYRNIKESKSRYLVYTKYNFESGDYTQEIPYVNIRGDVIKLVNQDIDLFLSDFKGKSNDIITYEYSISGVILSVIIKVYDYSTEYAPRAYFRSYNINIDRVEVISNESLLDFYGISEDGVSSLIENQFRGYYNDLVKNNYYSEDECNYNCFLKYREVSNYLDNVVYYVDKGDLYAYKPFVFYSIFGEEEYFKTDNYKFLLVKVAKNKED